jgi:hypothetical protein
MPSLGLAACLCTARRAIPTSFQQPDRWTLVDKGSASGKEIFQRGITWSQTLKAQGTVHGSQRIENNHRTAERIMMKPSTDDKTTGKLHEVEGAIKQKAGELTSNPKEPLIKSSTRTVLASNGM